MPEKPGIIFVSPWLLDGGIERVLEIKAPWFANRGHRVHVLAWEVAPTASGRPNPVLLAALRRRRHDRLADRILTVLDDQPLARHLAEQGRRRAEEFDMARLLPQLEHYYLYGGRGARAAA